MEQPVTGNATITRYGLGARGVDFMEQTSPSGAVTKGFPIYDAHGNNVATLYRNGSGYAVQNLRRYSAWGNVRGGSPTDGPKGKYCAALGHRQDDESGLVYMRARYYEPVSGRFLSEDPSRKGENWFAYGGNNPVDKADASGRSAVDFAYIWADVIRISETLYYQGATENMIPELEKLLRRVTDQAMESDLDDMQAFDQSAAAGEIDPDVRDYEASRTFEMLSENKIEKLAIQTNIKWLIELALDADPFA